MNPRSGGGKAADKFEAIFDLMDKAGLFYDYVFAETYKQIRNATAAAMGDDYSVIVAVGGDGTINATINGFYTAGIYKKPEKMLGIIYTGTSPDFCKSYGIPLDLSEAVESLKNHNYRKIRIGSIRLVTSLDPLHEETRYFSCCASIGIGAMVAEKANRYRKYAGDIPGTLGAIFSSLVRFHSTEMIIVMGDEEKTYRRVTNIFVGRTKYIASGLRVNEGIGDDDERFYVLTVHNFNLFRLPAVLKQLYSGDLKNSSYLSISYSENVYIYSPKIFTRVEFDGDPAGFTPCSINAVARPLMLIC
jgi:diacylglycerol kinase family enzyme